MSRRCVPYMLIILALATGPVLAGCSETQPEPAPEGEVTWSGEMRSLVAENCTVCHYTGGSTPFPFEAHEEVANASAAMVAAIEGRRMPPWPADPDCRSYENEMGLSEEEAALFRAWVEAGAPEGEPTEPIQVELAELDATHFATAKDAYTPNLGAAGDDYRCFLLDMEFDEATFVTGNAVNPDTEAVHHVLVYALTPAEVELAEELDAGDEGEGYTCFGGPLSGQGMGGGLGGGGLPNQVAAWVPGSEPEDLADAPIEIAAGSKLVMQMHYSAVGGAPQPDQTELQLRLTTDEPQFVLRTVPLAITQLDIPAGEDDVSFVSSFKNWSDRSVAISSLTGHMHLLGESIRAEQIAAGGERTCGVSIPEWDFDWQMTYQIAADAEIVVAPGDSIELTCTYDNTAENQPIVDGAQQEPRDVEWGDGSLDEMCLMYAGVIEPYGGPADDAVACAPAAECFAASDGSLTALMACEETNWGCTTCALQAGTECGLGACLLPLASAVECITNCVVSVNAFGGPIGSCLSETCSETYTQLLTCADPVLESGACDEALSGCGLEAP